MAKKSQNNYYAYVLPNGKEGLTETWGECEREVKGVNGARYRGFRAREEAEAWLQGGAQYEVKEKPTLEEGIYFDAGTGRGDGVEISVTDEKGKNLLHKALSKEDINHFGKHLVGRDATNNYGELLACKYALQIAMQGKIKKVFGDSKLVVDYWSKWRVKKEIAEETKALAKEVAGLRTQFEKGGGEVGRISGDHNPADLGFHR